MQRHCFQYFACERHHWRFDMRRVWTRCFVSATWEARNVSQVHKCDAHAASCGFKWWCLLKACFPFGCVFAFVSRVHPGPRDSGAFGSRVYHLAYQWSALTDSSKKNKPQKDRGYKPFTQVLRSRFSWIRPSRVERGGHPQNEQGRWSIKKINKGYDASIKKSLKNKYICIFNRLP